MCICYECGRMYFEDSGEYEQCVSCKREQERAQKNQERNGQPSSPPDEVYQVHSIRVSVWRVQNYQ